MTAPPARRRLRGFPPIERADARVLILGTMPGAASLAAARYYAHRRNAFWPIMEALLHWPAGADYETRTGWLRDAGIALWDVLRECHREGSLDTAIESDSMRLNDFVGFFRAHRHIRCVACNGTAAERLFRAQALPALRQRLWSAGDAAEPVLLRLPSTSPAHAGRRLEAKLDAWREALAPWLPLSATRVLP
jgi:hypoxanthine-DNA glycosylase